MYLYCSGFRLLSLLVLVILSGSASAQTTIANDKRLDRKTTVEAEGIALADLLPLLTEKTGISLTAHSSMADKKVIIFCRQQSLRDLLSGLATLFDAGWQTVPGPREENLGYEITLGLKAQNRDRDLLRETIRRLSSQVDTYVRALSLSPDELSQLPSDSPLREFLTAPNQRRGIELYSLLSDSQRESLWTKRRLAFSFSSLKKKQKQVVAAIFQDEAARLQAIADRVRDNPGIKINVYRLEQLLSGSVQFRLRRLGGPLTLMLQMPGFSIQLARTDDTALWLLPPHGDPYHPRHPVPVPPLPEADVVKASLSAGTEFSSRLRALADRSSFAIFADYYRSRPVIRNRAREADRPADGIEPDSIRALDDLCGGGGYLWWSREKTIFLRKRDWYLQQMMESPDSSIRKIIQMIQAENKRSTLEVVETLSLLSVEQIVGLNSIFTPLADESLLDGLPELLSALALLPAQQGQQLLEGSSVTLDIRTASPRIRRSAMSFLAVHALPETSARSSTLIVQMAPLAPPAREGAAANTSLEIYWKSGDLNGVYRVYLPHSLPGDNSKRFRVE